MAAERRAMENRVGSMLQYGVTLSAIIVLAGGAIYLHSAVHEALPNYAHFGSVSSPLAGFHREWSSLRTGNASAIIGAGLLVLILTPVLRVLMCIYSFAQEKNWLYVGVSSTVMAVLLYSLLHGR